jgi:hypothetical protein
VSGPDRKRRVLAGEDLTVCSNYHVFHKDELAEFLNVVEAAISHTLAAAFGRPVEVVVGPAQIKDADAVLAVALGGPPLRFDVEVKRSITPGSVAALGARSPNRDVILFTPRLTPAVLDACRQVGIGCADADGNLFLRSHSTVVDIQGRPATKSLQLGNSSDKATRLTSRSGLQIVFVLLSAPALRNETFRAVAAAADASLGSVAGVFQELSRRGYLTTTPKGRVLRRTQELFDIWVDAYQLRLYTRLRLGTFSTDVSKWWTTAGDAVHEIGGQWGGETALWVRKSRLRPARGVLYVDEIPSSFVSKLRLRRDTEPDAPVEFRRRFWNVIFLPTDVTVPTTLVYADLIAHGDPRLVEAAADLRRSDDALRRIDES